jgi:hypothetical protein
MSDQTIMTEILSMLVKITDPVCLKTIQNTAFNRSKDLRRTSAQVDTATWMVGDEVQMLPEYHHRKPYGAKGIIRKINKVKMKVEFPIGCYNVPKPMLMKAK